ncbi:MAG: hypothetical protein DCC75_11450, partial [Proteobacteria bacterium]
MAARRARLVRSVKRVREIDELEGLLALHERYAAIVRSANQECFELALQTAKQILTHELKSNPAHLLARIEIGLSQLLNRSGLKIEV